MFIHFLQNTVKSHVFLCSLFQLCAFLIFHSHLLIYSEPNMFLCQSLRARTGTTLVKKNMEDKDSRIVVKEILSFTLTEKVLTLHD